MSYRAAGADPGVREPRYFKNLPPDEPTSAELRPGAAEYAHHRLLSHRSGTAAPPIQNGISHLIFEYIIKTLTHCH